MLDSIAVKLQRPENYSFCQLIKGAELRTVTQEAYGFRVGKIGKICTRKQFRYSGHFEPCYGCKTLNKNTD